MPGSRQRARGAGAAAWAGVWDQGAASTPAEAARGRRPGPARGRVPGLRAARHRSPSASPSAAVRALTRFPAGSEVTVATLVEAGLVDHGPVKVLGGGRLAHALVVKAQAFSKGAKQAIAAAGGKAEIVR